MPTNGQSPLQPGRAYHGDCSLPGHKRRVRRGGTLQLIMSNREVIRKPHGNPMENPWVLGVHHGHIMDTIEVFKQMSDALLPAVMHSVRNGVADR